MAEQKKFRDSFFLKIWKSLASIWVQWILVFLRMWYMTRIFFLCSNYERWIAINSRHCEYASDASQKGHINPLFFIAQDLNTFVEIEPMNSQVIYTGFALCMTKNAFCCKVVNILRFISTRFVDNRWVSLLSSDWVVGKQQEGHREITE